ncbi:MAG: pyrimidine reductase [Chloroflexi bacterium]|nr:pyrimidine reductase [Chloroflexota bacterium]
MDDSVLQLYPAPVTERPLTGLFLSHNLRRISEASGQCFVYSNFVTSIDGRIAIPHPSRPGLMVPKDIANERDWRLYQELAAQADMIISSGRYLRDWADGRAQEILQIDDPRFADLRQWRQDRGLPPQPDIAIISGSLRFPIPDVLKAGGRKVVVFTSANPDPKRVAEIESKAGQVVTAGDKRVDGATLLQRMTEMGYRTVYSSTGPKVLHLLLAGGVLNRLYMTYANRLLGGKPFATIVDGPLFETAVDMKINTIHLDSHALGGLGQFFVSYDQA